MAPERHDGAAPESLVQEQTNTDAQGDVHQHSRNSVEVPTPSTIGPKSDNDLDSIDRSELVRIATALSRRQSSLASRPSHSQDSATFDENDPALNPEHRDFDLEKWLRRFMEQLSVEGLKEKALGVSYRHLDVFGSGSALKLQDTVGSIVTAPLKLGEFFSFNKKQTKQILHGFDGFLNPGELLIVLGRPGSGCSTLLKTICGELEGLKIGEHTKIHYNGIPQTRMMKEFKGEMAYNQEVRENEYSSPNLGWPADRHIRLTSISPISPLARLSNLLCRSVRLGTVSRICLVRSTADISPRLSWPSLV